MNKSKLIEFLQQTLFFFLGMLLLNLIFHRDQDLTQLVVKSIVVALLASGLGMLWSARSKKP